MKKFALTLAMVSVLGLGACTTNNGTAFFPVNDGRTAGDEVVETTVTRTTPVVRRAADRSFDSSLTK